MKYYIMLVLTFVCSSMFAQKVSTEDAFYKYELKSFDTEYLFDVSRNPGNGLVYLELNDWHLELEYSNLIAPNYRSIDENGNLIGDKEDLPIPMHGYTEKGGRVSLTIGKGFIYGYVRQGNSTYYIEPARYYVKGAKQDEFIIYDQKDVKPNAPSSCGVKASAEKKKELHVEGGTRAPGDCNIIEYAVCHDLSTVNRYGGASGANAFSTGVTNNVNTDYLDAFQEDYQFLIVVHYNSVGSDPSQWPNTTDPNVLLPNFRTWGNAELAASFNYDVASLWTERDFDGSTVGLAYLDVICGFSRYNVLENFSNNAEATRVLVSHELGHNCGAEHDGVNGFIMAPSIPFNPESVTSWTSSSITQIDSYLGSQNCFFACDPEYSFTSSGIGVTESGNSGSAGSCSEPFTLVNIDVTTLTLPAAGSSTTLNLSISGSSSATANYDYQLLTSSITFTNNSPTTQSFQIRIINDKISEGIENIIGNLSISSGAGALGDITQFTLDIGDDDFYNTPCCTSTTAFYGESQTYYSAAAIFDGSTSDNKSRMLLKASELQALGLTAGYLDQLSIYIFTKNSTAPFSDFRIGLAEVSISNLSGAPWYSTDEVFVGNYTTTGGAWNSITFDTPYLWNGTSNLYVEFCFNNSSIIGGDAIAFYGNNTISQPQFQFNKYTSGDGCAINPTGGTQFTLSDNTDVSPVALLRQTEIPVNVEQAANAEGRTRIRSGETAVLTSPDGELIAEITNTGTTSIGCISASVETAGNGKSALPFGNGDYSNKTFFINADNNSEYELTLFFAEAETTTWGSALPNLRILKSDVAIANANGGNSSFTSTSRFTENTGATGSVGLSASFSGSGYFAISDGEDVPLQTAEVGGVFEDSDFVIVEQGSGVLLKNSLGNQYLVSVDGSGNVTSTLSALLEPIVTLNENDLCILEATKSLYVRRGSNSYSRINVDNDGNLVSTNVSSVPLINVSLENGSLGLAEAGTGIIFQNSESECYRLYVDDLGNVQTQQIICP